MSLVERPFALNLLMRLLRVEVGGGMTPLLAADKLALLESLLPSLTAHLGPPSCIMFNVFPVINRRYQTRTKCNI